MTSIKTDFFFVTEPEPHQMRRRELLTNHPEVKKLISKNPVTFYVILLGLSIQLVVSYFLRDQAWYWILGVAWLFGAFVSHNLYVCIHEASHNLIFKKVGQNVFAGIVANFPSMIPTSVSFKNYHMLHHSYQGIHEHDADLPDMYEARLIEKYSFGKSLWLFLFPVFQMIRTLRFKEKPPIDKYLIMNVVAQIIFDVLVIYFLGWGSALYMFASFWFSLGLHPLGARWIQEHYLVFDEKQETHSYYGNFNRFNLNIGFHNEHHDMPSVPWNNLPKLKETAPELYDTIYSHKSLTKLFFRFIFDQEITLFNRIARKEKGKVTPI